MAVFRSIELRRCVVRAASSGTSQIIDAAGHVRAQRTQNQDLGVLLGQVDSEPCGGALRTGTWREGDTIRDTVQLHIEEGTPPGNYELATGFYTWPDITPLELEGRDQGLLGALEINQ